MQHAANGISTNLQSRWEVQLGPLCYVQPFFVNALGALMMHICTILNNQSEDRTSLQWRDKRERKAL